MLLDYEHIMVVTDEFGFTVDCDWKMDFVKAIGLTLSCVIEMYHLLNLSFITWVREPHVTLFLVIKTTFKLWDILGQKENAF